jgi:hypothetical protein
MYALFLGLMLRVCQPPLVRIAEAVIKRTDKVKNLEIHGI